MSMPDAELAALARSRTLDVAILLFPDVEVLDFAGPFEVFSVASRIHRGTEHRPFRVSTVAAERMPVPARHGLPVIANYTFEEQARADVLIVAGGIVDQPLGDPKTLAWLSAASKEAALTASVCTGAFLLAKIGLLKGRRATTHWEDIPELRAAHPDLAVIEDVPYVDEGRIVTSAGISAGIDMSLHLVRRILGFAAAQATARQMQYDWSEARAVATA
jgi:transcriptional regulator GlxA family with amidase domain